MFDGFDRYNNAVMDNYSTTISDLYSLVLKLLDEIPDGELKEETAQRAYEIVDRFAATSREIHKVKKW